MELLQLVKGWKPGKFFLDFVIAESDKTSEPKMRSNLKNFSDNTFAVHRIPRAREVGQSWSSTIFTTAQALVTCLYTVFVLRPKLVLVNGPGTCVPVVAVALLYECMFCRRFSLVFVESFCRTRTLSMTGKIVYPLADRVVVHHKKLVESYPKAEYLGCIY